MRRAKVLFLGGFFYESEIARLSKGRIEKAANKHQMALLNGLASVCELSAISLPFVGTFPRSFKKGSVSALEFSPQDKAIRRLSLSFLNMPLVKSVSRLWSTVRLLKRFIQRVRPDAVIVYGAHSPFLLGALLVRRFVGLQNLCVVVTDLPEYMTQPRSRGRVFKIAKWLDSRLISMLLARFDRFILLAEPMYDRLKLNNKPFLVEEGIFHPPVGNESLKSVTHQSKQQNSKLRILYAGGLSERNGITELLRAADLRRDDVELIICGTGDLEPQIRQKSQTECNIEFLGFLDDEALSEVSRSVDCFINPRQPTSGDFVRYSFPSKTMEYLASGKPVICAVLPGMPSVYKEFVFELKSSGAEGICECIDDLLRAPPSQVKERALAGQDYVFRFKSSSASANRIVNFIWESKK